MFSNDIFSPQNGCLLFSSTDSEQPDTAYSHSVSGPRHCAVCSQPGACVPGTHGENVVDTVAGVAREETCQELCRLNTTCHAYTW